MSIKQQRSIEIISIFAFAVQLNQFKSILANDLVTHTIAHLVAYKKAYDDAVSRQVNVAREFNLKVFDIYEKIFNLIPGNVLPIVGAAGYGQKAVE